MTATKLPEGTDSIIEDSEITADGAGTPGFGATGSSFDRKPGTGGASFGSSEGVDLGAGSFDDEDEPAAPAGPTADDAKAALGDAKAKIGETAAGLKGQATDKAREYALVGKDRASETLHNVARMIDDAAATVDDKVGSQYGDYGRQASGFVKNFAAGIDEKDIDELFAQGRDLVRKSPGLAIGFAAALGFLATRVVKAGLEPVGSPANVAGYTPSSPPSA